MRAKSCQNVFFCYFQLDGKTHNHTRFAIVTDSLHLSHRLRMFMRCLYEQ